MINKKRNNRRFLKKESILFIMLLSFPFTLWAQLCVTEAKPGDIIFQEYDCGDLCRAIAGVTQSYHSRNYTHCGIVISQDNSLWVLEAVSPVVKLTPIDSFLSRTASHSGNTLARVKEQYSATKNYALLHYPDFIGKSYDDCYTLGDDSYYCSELIYELFKNDDGSPLFELKPMTFISPKTNKIIPEWVSYFSKLNCAIPEGEPGINPGGISLSDKVVVLGDFK